MTIKIYNHPDLIHAQDVKEICSPLEHLNITYFAHVHIDKDRKFSSISNNPDFHEHYIKKEYYNADIHMSSDSNLGNYIIWDAIDCHGESAQMNKEAEEFGIRHSFTIVNKKNAGKSYYHFSTNTPEKQ